MKITKILLVISSLFAFTAANAGELTVTGNMETNYIKQNGATNGNPLSSDRELKFAGSTELDNGITVSVMQDTSDSLGYGNSQLAFGNVLGLATIYIGSDADPVDGIDDITPSAYEEANGSGSGTYVDIGSNAGSMGIGTKISLPKGIALDAKYYPKADGNKTADGGVSGDASAAKGKGFSSKLTSSLGEFNGMLDGANLTLGFAMSKNVGTIADTDTSEATAALNYAYGPMKFGYQRKYNDKGSTSDLIDTTWYKDEMIGVAYAVNDSLSISYNRVESYKSGDDTLGIDSNSNKQETEAYNIGYTIGGMTIGLQQADTSNAGYVKNAKDDSKTVGIAVAF